MDSVLFTALALFIPMLVWACHVAGVASEVLVGIPSLLVLIIYDVFIIYDLRKSLSIECALKATNTIVSSDVKRQFYLPILLREL